MADVLRRHPPAPLDLARYAYAGLAAQQAAGQGGAPPDAATFPPVSFYLPEDLARAAEQLRAAALMAVHEARLQVRRQALELHPGRTGQAAIARGLFTAGELARLGLPFARQIPAGTIARMAVSRWAARSPDAAVAAAVAYASDVHDQPHRARADMRGLRALGNGPSRGKALEEFPYGKYHQAPVLGMTSCRGSAGGALGSQEMQGQYADGRPQQTLAGAAGTAWPASSTAPGPPEGDTATPSRSPTAAVPRRNMTDGFAPSARDGKRPAGKRNRSSLAAL